MRIYTVHLKPDRAPVLLREGWSLGALLFGPLWLLSHRAWIPAALFVAVWVLAAALLPAPLRGPALLGVALITAVTGRDMVRWSLARRGYVLAHVVAARDWEGALGRLLSARQDLLEGLA